MAEPERMTAAEYQAMAAGGKSHKYSAERTQLDGIWFDSKKEANRYSVLRIQEKAGLIKSLELQPKYAVTCGGVPVKIRSTKNPNGRQVFVKLDFRYFDILSGCIVVEDAKGMDTPISRLKRALVEAEHGVQVKVI